MKPCLWAVVAAFSTFSLIACGKGGFSERVQSGKENFFRYPLTAAPTTLDPHLVQDGPTIDLLQQVYEGLVGWGEDNRVAPILAESWEILDGGRRYRFKIRSGIRFTSGREVTAEDFKWSLNRALNPKLSSPVAMSYLSDIVGARDVVEGRAQSARGIEVVDEKTLDIVIDKPRPYFLGKLTYPTAYVVDRDRVSADAEITKIEDMVGTGPFLPESYVDRQLFVLVSNKNYHGGEPGIERIERPIILDPATVLNKYKGGELDIAPLQRQDIAAVQADPNLRSHLRFFDRAALWYVGLNGLVYEPFKDRRVRRAFAMAIDKDEIVRERLGGINPVANSILPPGVLGFRSDAQAIAFDVEEAKKLLAEAGYPDGAGLPEFELVFREKQADIQLVAEAVAAQLQTNLGVRVRLRTMEWGAYLQKHDRKELGFFHMRWAADYLDPENFLSLLLASYGNQNLVGYSNPEFDALCAAADVELDQDKRLALYAKAEDLVLQDAPFIPIYFQRDAELVNPRVQGLRESLFGHLPHTRVRLVRRN